MKLSVNDATIQFFDNVLPPLTAQDYRIAATQTIDILEQYEPPALPYSNVRRIRVTGPHFALGPNEVFSFNPPANSQADYSTMLPHVVLATRTTPWSIALKGQVSSGPLVSPWMALLLFTPEEIISPPTIPGQALSLTRTQTIALASYLEPPSCVLGPKFSVDDVNDFLASYPGLNVTTIDVTPGTLTAIAPTLGELPYLAHARFVNTEAQEMLGAGEDGWFSVVVGNRLPFGSANCVYIAHLVSLEGFSDYLHGGATFPTGTEAVRLISLASWTFNSAKGADFAALMKHLDIDTLRLPTKTLMGPARSALQPTVAAALDDGYTALRYQTRLGEETVGWYRGPFVPRRVVRNIQPSYSASEAALVYNPSSLPADPSTGMFDLSFSVAWQIGRLLALADSEFLATLLAWIREKNSVAQLLLERTELFREYDSLVLPEDVDALIAPGAVRRHAFQYLARVVAPRLAPADPTEPPLLGAPLDPSGLRLHGARMPGLLSRQELAEVMSCGKNPCRELLARVRAAARGRRP